ncbi:hypothetical protein D9599_24120 [Roseomonas sp. KE2513]|nr:hypothetical protein [Roseomonas sp. KE2513]
MPGEGEAEQQKGRAARAEARQRAPQPGVQPRLADRDHHGPAGSRHAAEGGEDRPAIDGGQFEQAGLGGLDGLPRLGRGVPAEIGVHIRRAPPPQERCDRRARTREVAVDGRGTGQDMGPGGRPSARAKLGAWRVLP